MIARERSLWYALSPRRTPLPEGAVVANHSRELLVGALKEAIAGGGPGRSRLVILPAFVCNTLVDAVLTAGGEPAFHGLNANLTPRFDEIEQRLEAGAAAWLVVDYFGMQPEIPDALWDKARSLGCRVIHDGAHSFLGLMLDPTRATAGFDYSVFSIYKAFATGTGAIGVGPFAQPSRVRLPLMAVMAARKVVKHLIAPLAAGRLINRDMERLRHDAPAMVAPPRGGAGGAAVLRFLVEHRDYAAIRAQSLEAAIRAAAAARMAGASPVFDDDQCRRNVLQGVPVRFATQADRDRAIAHFRRCGVEAHTWPTFSTLADDAALWRTLLVLPAHARAADVLGDQAG